MDSSPGLPARPKRFVGIDLHRRWVVIAAVDRDQQLLMSPRKLSVGEFPLWADQHLTQDDVVAIEASSNAWHWYDLLRPLVAEVVVAHAAEVRAIASARVKTDRQDCLKLARLLAAGLLPEVWVPPADVRELRRLLGHRRALVSQRTRLRNYLQSLLVAHQILPPAGELFSPARRAWWDEVPLSSVERLQANQHFAQLDQLDLLLEAAEREVAAQSASERWRPLVPFLVQLPGSRAVSRQVIP